MAASSRGAAARDGPDFSFGGGMTLSEDGRTLLLFDHTSASILGLTVATGDRVILSR